MDVCYWTMSSYKLSYMTQYIGTARCVLSAGITSIWRHHGRFAGQDTWWTSSSCTCHDGVDECLGYTISHHLWVDLL